MNDADALATIRAAYREMGRLVDAIDWRLLDSCDCSHRRCEHLPSQHHQTGQEPCGHRDCMCADFDQLHQRVDAHLNGRGT